VVAVLLISVVAAQQVPPPGMGPRPQLPERPQPQIRQPPPAVVNPQNQAAQQQPTTPTGAPTVYGGLTLNNASLSEVIDMLARQLHLNYVLDPRVKGGVILNTYGETKNIDTRSLLEAILRINGFGMVQQGELYRIVPLNEISHQPLHPESVTSPKEIPEDDRTMLNLVFLKYATAEDLAKLLDPFRGENSTMFSYAPANLLLILDSRRNMRRTMELIALFDNDTLANQRVRLFETKNGRPADLVKELESIVKSISLNEKSSPIKFLPVDRINTIIAVASNPGAFAEVEKWLAKLDIPVKATAGAMENHVYRLKYGNACVLAMGITMLYGGGGFGMGMVGMGGMGMCSMGMGGGMMGGGMMGGGMMGGGMYGGGMMGGGMYGGGMMGGGMYGGGAYGGGMYGGGMYGGGAYGGGMYGGGYGQQPQSPLTSGVPATGGGTQTPGTSGDLTGTYLGNAPLGGPANPRAPRIIPNPYNNSLMIQATPQDYEQILNLLRDMDIPPRQVLIDARIYEVDLGSSLSSGVAATLQAAGGANASPDAHHFLASLAGSATNLSDGFLVGRTKELLAAVQVLEGETKAKVISAPSVIATDSIPASINVGVEVPTLTAQAVTGAQQNGTSLFANTIASRNTGVTLQITAQVNPSGIVTMMINQNVSAPEAASAGQIQSPSFSNRTVSTQVTVQDGDTIAVGGIITESNTFSTTGIPYLNRIPILGAAFGTRSYAKQRTELIVFMTPRVIYDTNEIQDASDELKGRLKHLEKMTRNQ